ncbi:MAG: amidohydrolase, partial [Saprospiraceae bacterium]
MKYIINIIFFALIGQMLVAQQTPAPAQSKPIIIMNATAHLGNGKVIENSAIAFENGKLSLVADAKTIRLDLSKYEVVKAEGKHVYPGFIAPNTIIGLVEIEAVRATRDDREVGEMNPSIRALIAYNTDSKVTPTIRSNGVMLAQVVPQGGTIPGQSSVMSLDGWNWEDAQYKADEGIHLEWPAPFRRTGWWAAPGPIEKSKTYDKNLREIDEFFKEAQGYINKTAPEKTNLKFEAMKGLFNGQKQLYIHTNFAKPMMEAVLWAEKYGITPVIIGGKDSWQITDFLKEHKVMIILNQPQALPVRDYDDIDMPYKTPSILEKAGVTFCLSMNGGWEQRNLVFQGGQAISYGLDKEAAVKALT